MWSGGFQFTKYPVLFVKRKRSLKKLQFIFSQSQGSHFLSVEDTMLKAMTSDHIQILAVVKDRNILVDKDCHCSISHRIKIAIQTVSFTLSGGWSVPFQSDNYMLKGGWKIKKRSIVRSTIIKDYFTFSIWSEQFKWKIFQVLFNLTPWTYL